jgi:hypothetical protein
MKEFALYAIVTPEGECPVSYASEKAALRSKHYTDGCTIVKLGGTLPEQKRMKKVATYAFKDSDGQYWEAKLMCTEDEAKQRCDEDGDKLMKWPYGEIIEVEE